MQKKSRFLTGLLSAVMALTLFALPATAADEGVANQLTNTDVWGKSTASITIHKYEFNGNSTTHATGNDLEADGQGSSIPTDAEGLNGVTFKIYQVQDRETLANYYSGIQKAGENYTDFTSVSKYYNAETGVVKNGKGTDITGRPDDEQTTDTVGGKDGIAKFDIANDKLGLYLVVETSAPDKVTQIADAFLVSVPMKQPKDQKTWLYDIHVYPKNKTTYGNVSIVKKGITGGDTATELAGVTFKLEKKKVDADNGITWTPVTESEKDGTKFNLVTNASGEISVSGLSQGTYHFVEVSGNGQGYILSEKPIEFVITDNGKLDYNNEKDKKDAIVVENYRPDLDKKVYNNTLAAYEEGADYSVGDEVPYQITVKVPQNITQLKTFTVTDNPENLKDVTSTITITTKDNDNADAEVNKDAYTIGTQVEGENGFTITFHPKKMTTYAGKNLVISYKAKLLQSADQTTAGNKNDAKLTYTNKIKENGEGDDKSTNTIEDETVVYTFAIRIKKTDGGSKLLPGAKFDLYKDVTNEYAGKEQTELAAADVITGADASEKGLDKGHYWKRVAKELTSGNDGLVTTKDGLANGTYYLVETQAPADYNLLAKPVEVKLNVIYKYTWSELEQYTNGNLVKHETSKRAETFNSTTEGAGAKTVGSDNSDDTTTGLKQVQVINRQGFTLPRTGGFGTLLFSGIGALLVVGGVGVLMGTKKKKDNA